VWFNQFSWTIWFIILCRKIISSRMSSFWMSWYNLPNQRPSSLSHSMHESNGTCKQTHTLKWFIANSQYNILLLSHLGLSNQKCDIRFFFRWIIVRAESDS
jgi:hypothetical protein